MTISVDFNITKLNTDTIIVKDSDSGWDTLPTAKLVLTIRDKIYTNNVLSDRYRYVVLYDPDATDSDDIGTSVDDQIAGVLFTEYISDTGLILTSSILYGSAIFIDSFYQVSIESTSDDIIAATIATYYTTEIETIGMVQAMYLDRPYTDNLTALKATIPWHLADACALAGNQNDSILFYQFLQFINRNYKSS